MSDDAASIIAHQGELENARANNDSFWQQIDSRVAPSTANFTSTNQEGEQVIDRAFDTTASTGADRFSAFLSEGVTPRGSYWHGLDPEDEDLADDQESKEFLERLAKALFARRYRPSANFVSQRQENYLGMAKFGNYSLFIDEVVGQGVRYRAIPMQETYWEENHDGIIDIEHRKYELTARKALKKFGKDCPPKVREDAENQRNSGRLHTFIHCVRPNEERKSGRQDYRGMPWASYHVYVGEKSVISRGGYWTFPYANGRFMKGPRETYARSPAATAFPAILTLNEQKKTVLRAGQSAVWPSVLMSEDGALEPFSMRSGAVNPGMLNEQGQELVKPFNNGAKIEMGIELMVLEQRAINDAFMVSLFQILAEKPNMTATEVLSRLQEKAELLSPTTGRLEAEDTGPMIEREIDLYMRSSEGRWVLEEMPDQLRERGGAYKVTYTSPLARARRAAEALAIMRTYEAGAVIAASDPSAILVLKGTESLRTIADINGMPAKLLRTPEEVEEMQRRQEQQKALAAMTQGAPDIAGAAKNLAEADQIRATLQ